MRSAFCLVGDPSCARFRLLAYMTAEEIPRDLIPTDAQRADDLIAESKAKPEEWRLPSRPAPGPSPWPPNALRIAVSTCPV